VGPASLELLLLGELDALFLYESVAASVGLPSIQLPPEINLSSPAQTGRYAAVSYRAGSGQTFRGAPIAFFAPLYSKAHVAAKSLSSFSAFLPHLPAASCCSRTTWSRARSMQEVTSVQCRPPWLGR
jgi:hypothetical protein